MNQLGLIFTIEIDGRPTIAFEAKNLREAMELCHAHWVRDDMMALSSGGVPLCTPISKLKARIAQAPERERYQTAEHVVQASEDLVLAYLVPLDGLG